MHLTLTTFVTTNPIALIVAAIAGLIVIFVSLWQNCEGFRNFWIELWNNVVNAISSAWETITGIIDGIISAVNDAINAVKEFFGLGGGSGSSGGPNTPSRAAPGTSRLRMVPENIPALANGGALYGPQTVLAGEYPGASQNPEIVAPQSLMKETMESANAGVINAVMAMGE